MDTEPSLPLYFFRREHSADSLRKQARFKSGSVCQRMLLIANLMDGMEVDDAARLVGLRRCAAYKWHNQYEEYGIDGLCDRPRSGKKRRVSDEIGQEIHDRICAGADIDRDGIVSFRGLDVKNWLENDYGIKLGNTATYDLLHRLKLSWLVPRPRHWMADAQAQEEFRKLSDCN